MSLTRRSHRTRNAPIVYTPTRLGTEVATLNTRRRSQEQRNSNIDNSYNDTNAQNETSVPYTLNIDKAMSGKIEAANRESQIRVEMKHDNLVLELTAACYEEFKSVVKGCLVSKHIKYDITTKTDKNNLLVEEQISVKNSHKKQQYRINCYNTSSRVLINGNALELFLRNILPEVVILLSQNKSFDKLNSLIRQTCSKYLEQSNSNYGTPTAPIKHTKSNQECNKDANPAKVKTTIAITTPYPVLGHCSTTGQQTSVNNNTTVNKVQSESTRNNNTTVNMVQSESVRTKHKPTNESTINSPSILSDVTTDPELIQDTDSYAICPICNVFCKANSVECSICTYWFHYVCLNIQPKESRALETSNSPYTCRGCVHMQDFLDCEQAVNRSSIIISTSDDTSMSTPDAISNAPITTDKTIINTQDVTPNSTQLKRGRPKKATSSNTEEANDSVSVQQTPTSCADLVTKNSMSQQNNEVVPRSELQNKEKQLRAIENKLSKTELDLNQTKKQLVTAKAFIAKLEDKCKDMEESNRIQKTKILLLEGIHNNDENQPRNNPSLQRQCSCTVSENNPMMQIYEQRIRQLELENVRNACRMDSIENLVKIENLTTQLNISKNNAQTHGTSSQNSLNSATLPTFQTRNNGIPIVVNHPNVRNVGNDNSPQNFNQASTNSGHPSNIINENVQPAKLNTTHATSNDSLPTDNSKQPLTGNSDSMQSEQQATFCPTNQSFLVNAPTLTKPPWMNYSHCQIKPMQTQQQHVAPVIYRHPQTVHQNQMMVANPHFPQKIMRQIPTNFVNLSWYPTTSRVSAPVNRI